MSSSILETLDALSLAPDEQTETVGQCLDLLSQALERWHVARGEERIRRSLGGHALALSAVQAPESLCAALEQARNTRRELDLVSLDAASVGGLVQAARAVVVGSERGGEPAELRVRYRPVMVNTVGVETPEGFRQFQLNHGSAIQIPCDLLVISARLSKEGEVDGQVANALRWRYGMTLDPEARLLTVDSEVWTSLQPAAERAPFDHVLVLWIPSDSERAEAVYDRAIEGVFASLLAAEHLGIAVRRVGLSYLGGHRVQGLETAVETLVFGAIRWLKRAARAEEIGCALLRSEDVAAWNRAMDGALGRAYVGEDSDPVLEALRAEVLAYARRYKEGYLEPALRPMVEALQVKGPMCIELICTFARALCELTAKQSLVALGKKPGGDLLSSIEKLRQSGTVAPWVCSYMHGLRVLGNKSVHPADRPPRYEPKRLDSSDLVSALAATRCLLTWWDRRETMEASP